MNKAKLKSYAPQARKDFIAAVTARANLLGLSEKAGKLEVATSQPQGDATVIAGQAWPMKVHSQRQQLIARIQKDGFAQTMEAVAYTWFNRFAALRYMELHDYLGHGHRALSSLEGTLPDILTHAADLAQSGAGEGGLPGLNPAMVVEMKLAGNRDGELYRLLLVAQCNALSNVMPFLFERIDDETELLLPDNLLRTDSVVAKLVTAIDEEDWGQVEIIGWLYQFYISEKKDEVIGKVVRSEDIPAATQLFTPNWIVQYLVQNSVGRLWLMANPASALKAQWPYYIAPADQAPGVQAQLDSLIQTRVNEDGDSLNPESITLLDPACGSGHILVEAYAIFKEIYLERGYQPRSIPRLILEKNLFGLDIDDRAAQMACFALLMKARADDRRLFNEPIKLNVLSLQESRGLDAEVLTRALQTVTRGPGLKMEARSTTRGFADDDLFPGTHPQATLKENVVDDIRHNGPAQSTIAALIGIFAQAKTFGSLIQIPQSVNTRLAVLTEYLQAALHNGDLYTKAAVQDLMPLVEQARLLGMQFDAVVANPPYMGAKYLAPSLKRYLQVDYKGYEKDLFSAFMIRDLKFTKESGQLGFMSPFVWMFISSYEEMRQHFIDNATLTSLVQLEYSGFEGATVPICTFILAKSHIAGFRSSFIRLSDFRGFENQGPKTLEAIRNPACEWFYIARPDDFIKLPGAPIAYWMSEKAWAAFKNGNPIIDFSKIREGINTGDNDRFLKLWHEVDFSEIKFDSNNDLEIKVKWVPHNKGGRFRKWYGNTNFVLNWKNHGEEIHAFHGLPLDFKGAPMRGKSFFFMKSISWSRISSGEFAARFYDAGYSYDSTAPSLFSDHDSTLFFLGFLNSKVVGYFLAGLSPTLDYRITNVGRLPVFMGNDEISHKIRRNSEKLIDMSRKDWDGNETSFSFTSFGWLADAKKDVASLSWESSAENKSRDALLAKQLEEENNSIFIDAYDLKGELSPEISDAKITVAQANREKDCQYLISYAVGCMMGRYSLDAPGLVYAHAGNVGFNTSCYSTFPADADGIVPLTDELWFEDEAASRIREFMLAVWSAESLVENMAWLAESLGAKAGEAPDETIRRYLADKFYKDHLQTYKKRPIYWLFSSGKQGAFQALVYLHRYHEGTLSRMRAEYVVPLTGKIQSRIDMLEKDAATGSSTAARNKLTKEVEKLKKKHIELLAYDEQLRHYADMRINLDLDDGVKVNYGKFGDLLAEVKAVTGGGSDD